MRFHARLSERESQDFDCASLVEKQESEGTSTACCVTAVWAGGSGVPVSLEQRDVNCDLCWCHVLVFTSKCS